MNKMITIDENSLYECLDDIITICKSQKSDTPINSIIIADNLLKHISIRANMLSTLDLPENREFWGKIKNLISEKES